ncbi:MAG: nicotinate phosphoribosyltransferase [Gammaproteobacteria bacterium]|nr:nicotinate phosphoribosyltransferase [Gammaproteobacteria bacterium]
MMQAVLHHFPGAMVEYGFTCRTPNVDLRPYAEEIKKSIQRLCSLQFTEEELNHLKTFRFFKSDFIDFLRIFHLNADFVSVEVKDKLEIVIRGPWLHTILFEVPILAIVNEVYYRSIEKPDYAEGRLRLANKIKLVKSTLPLSKLYFSEYGTRRRFSFEWQEEVVRVLRDELSEHLLGTSNVYLAKKLNIRPQGTMAHEFLQAHQALGSRLIDSQKMAFENWAKEYRGDLGIALSDTYGMDAFLRDFDLYFCKLFDGARHDSGDPFLWGEKLIAHYEKKGIDSKTKTMIFSDKLDFNLALAIKERFETRSNPVFGIGTNLSNDLGYQPLQNVIKMMQCNGQPVAKITDEPNKASCQDASYLAYLKQVFKVV